MQPKIGAAEGPSTNRSAEADLLTAGGHFGLASKAVQPNDSVWIVCGSKTPCLLRAEPAEGHLRLVGAVLRGRNHVWRGRAARTAAADCSCLSVPQHVCRLPQLGIRDRLEAEGPHT